MAAEWRNVLFIIVYIGMHLASSICHIIYEHDISLQHMVCTVFDIHHIMYSTWYICNMSHVRLLQYVPHSLYEKAIDNVVHSMLYLKN